VLYYVLFVCKCVLYCYHRVTTQLQLRNISYIWYIQLLISELYMDHDVTRKLRLGQGETRSAKSVIGVRHGCCSSPILFNLYKKYFTKETVERFENFKIVQQAICAMKYAD